MDSINNNQPEHNFENLMDGEAAAKIKDLVKEGQSCFFCTSSSSPGSCGTRPMSVLKVDDQANLWFMSAKDSHKNLEIERDSKVKLYMQGSKHSDFIMIEGDAIITFDKARIHELWNPMIKTWFTEGENDPRISVIKFVPSAGYYWDTKHGMIVAGIKMLIGAMTGTTLDDSIEGTLRL